MNIMQKATKHGLSGLLLAVTVLGSVAPLAAMSTPIYADNNQQTGNSDEVSGKPALAKQNEIGTSDAHYHDMGTFNRGFQKIGTPEAGGLQLIGHDKDPQTGETRDLMQVGLTTGAQHQFGSFTFRRKIDMTETFRFKGSLNITKLPHTNTLGDSLGFILAPVPPAEIQKGSTGGYLGIGVEPEHPDTGFKNAFFWGADLHYNPEPDVAQENQNPDKNFDGNTEFGDPNAMRDFPGNDWVMFRSTDEKGNLDNLRNHIVTRTDPVVYPVPLNKDGGDNAVELSWKPDKTGTENGPGDVEGTLTATGWGHIWHEHITVAREMSFSAISATGGETSTMSLKPVDFTLTVGTVPVKFTASPVSTGDKATFTQPDFGTNPKKTVVGTHITVISSDITSAQIDELKAEPNYEPDYVYVAPKVDGFKFVGDGNGYKVFDPITENNLNDSNTLDLKYNRVSREHIDYQFANQPGVYINKKDSSDDDGKTYTEVTPQIPGFTPDKATVTGTYNGDHNDLVTYYPTPSLPLNAGANGVVDPTKPVTPTNGTSTKQNLNTSNGLSLDYVPDFNFGKHEIESGTTTYAADDLKTNQGDMPLFAQVTDVRTDPGNWTLAVKAGPMTNKATQSVLSGAYMTFGSSDVKTTSKDNEVSKVLSNFAGQQLNFDDKAEMNVASSSSPEQATWLTRFIKKDQVDAVTLHVPGGAAQKGDYQAVLTWTLGSKPGDNQQ